MKILYIITKSTSGGAQTHIAQLARKLTAEGHRVALMSAPGGWLEKEIVALGGTLYPNNYFKNSYNALLLFPIRRLIKLALVDFQPDVISCHSGFAGFIARVCIRNRVPTIFTAHGWSFSPGVGFIQRSVTLAAERIAARWATQIICVSDYDRGLALRYRIAAPEKIHTIHNGVEIPIPAPAPRTALRRIVWVGRMTAPKRPLDLLRAFVLIPEPLRAALHVSFVGDGPRTGSIQLFTGEHHIQRQITLCGDLRRSDVLDIVAASDVCVLLSDHEGLPRSLLEALAHGVPVVASDVGGISELIQEDVGYLLPRTDEAQRLAAALEKLYADPDLLHRMSINAYARARDHFSLGAMLASTIALYEQTING